MDQANSSAKAENTNMLGEKQRMWEEVAKNHPAKPSTTAIWPSLLSGNLIHSTLTLHFSAPLGSPLALHFGNSAKMSGPPVRSESSLCWSSLRTIEAKKAWNHYWHYCQRNAKVSNQLQRSAWRTPKQSLSDHVLCHYFSFSWQILKWFPNKPTKPRGTARPGHISKMWKSATPGPSARTNHLPPLTLSFKTQLCNLRSFSKLKHKTRTCKTPKLRDIQTLEQNHTTSYSLVQGVLSVVYTPFHE